MSQQFLMTMTINVFIGVPKLHKYSSELTNFFFRRSFFRKLLNPCIDSNYCCQNSFNLTQEIKDETLDNKFLVLFDGNNLFID